MERSMADTIQTLLREAKESSGQQNEDSVLSMDVLDDYTLGHVLSLIRFTDKIKLERVCKRWQQLMFRDQEELIINRQRIDWNSLNRLRKNYRCPERKGLIGVELRALKTVLWKCPKIKTVCLDIFFNGKALALIGQCCPRLVALKCDLTGVKVKPFVEFARKYGYRLESVQMHANYFEQRLMVKQFLSFCPNVKKIPRMTQKSVYIDKEKCFLPKLEEACGLVIKPPELWSLKLLSQKYKLTMKKMEIFFFCHLAADIMSSVSYICCMVNLLYLSMNIFDMRDHQSKVVDILVAQIGRNLNKLKKLNLCIGYSLRISNDFLSVFAEFQSIEFLEVKLLMTKRLNGSIKSFAKCCNLISLVMHCPRVQLSKHFLAIELSILSKLQFIKIYVKTDLSKKSIPSLGMIENLEAVVTESWLKTREYYFGKSLKRKISEDRTLKMLGSSCGIIENNFDY